MKFALVNKNKLEAAKGLTGLCPSCGSELIAKCGTFKINHWAHKGNRNCDPWWENETEWHRQWKGYFDPEWQEFVHRDNQTGEKHIADIFTPNELVIEFQHSYLNPTERISRERFYKKMIWVVDGTRLKTDYSRFCKRQATNSIFFPRHVCSVSLPEECLPKDWIRSSVPVVIDFQGIENQNEIEHDRKILYCILPIKLETNSYIVGLKRDVFVERLKIDGLFEELMKLTNEVKLLHQRHQSMAQSELMNQFIHGRMPISRKRW